jgi:divalent metal cation (Fe/Co/Zn/Cd) transporter
MSGTYGHILLHGAVKYLDEVSDGILKDGGAEEAAGVIKGCAISAAIAGVGSGWIPGAGGAVATAAFVASIWTMYVLINKELGISIKDNILKTLASAFLTNILATAGSVLLGLAVGTVLSFIPGIGTVGSIAIDAMIGYIVVLVSGILYLNLLGKMCEKYGSVNFEGKDVKSLAKEVVDSSDIKEMINEAKASYKEDKKSGKIKK